MSKHGPAIVRNEYPLLLRGSLKDLSVVDAFEAGIHS